ncbi:hypothetical protein KL921_004932 [Ogataea angusta]|nr:hypothetical protein KL921_004932 [Ogataea angusta]
MDSESNCKLENKRAVVQTHCPGADGDVWVRGVDKAGQPGSGATHKAHQTSPVHAAGVPINAFFAENRRDEDGERRHDGQKRGGRVEEEPRLRGPGQQKTQNRAPSDVEVAWKNRRKVHAATDGVADTVDAELGHRQADTAEKRCRARFRRVILLQPEHTDIVGHPELLAVFFSQRARRDNPKKRDNEPSNVAADQNPQV